MSRRWPLLLLLVAIVAVIATVALLVRSTNDHSASLHDDPFSGIALPMQASGTATHGDPGSETAPVIDQAELAAAVHAFAKLHPAATGTASFSVTMLPDGRLANVRYLEGSLNALRGAAFAEMLDAKRIYRPGTETNPTRTVLGPIAVK